MNEKKNCNNYKSICYCVAAAVALAIILGLAFRPLVSHAAAPEDSTLTDANSRLQGFRDAAAVASSDPVATDTDVDRSPYLTNDVTIMQTNDYLLSIRNILVCIWFTIIIFWSYDRMKAIILRLGGFRKNE